MGRKSGFALAVLREVVVLLTLEFVITHYYWLAVVQSTVQRALKPP